MNTCGSPATLVGWVVKLEGLLGKGMKVPMKRSLCWRPHLQAPGRLRQSLRKGKSLILWCQRFFVRSSDLYKQLLDLFNDSLEEPDFKNVVGQLELFVHDLWSFHGFLKFVSRTDSL